jgi:hypothetical protein
MAPLERDEEKACPDLIRGCEAIFRPHPAPSYEKSITFMTLD